MLKLITRALPVAELDALLNKTQHDSVILSGYTLFEILLAVEHFVQTLEYDKDIESLILQKALMFTQQARFKLAEFTHEYHLLSLPLQSTVVINALPDATTQVSILTLLDLVKGFLLTYSADMHLKLRSVEDIILALSSAAIYIDTRIRMYPDSVISKSLKKYLHFSDIKN